MSSTSASSSSHTGVTKEDTAIDLGTGLLQPVNIAPRPSLRPLSSSRLANAPSATNGGSSSRLDTLKHMSASMGSLEGMDTPTKLKRLSLVPSPSPSLTTAGPSRGGDGRRPGSLDLDRLLSGSASEREQSGENEGRRGGPSTPRSGRRLGIRSSISYSPATSVSIPLSAPVRSNAALEEALKRPSLSSSSSAPTGATADAEGRERERRAKEKEKKRGQTLTEKHGELLTLIAAKERKVSELKQELAAQEASLHALKSRWTSIISRSTTPRITQTAPSSSLSSSSSSGAGHGPRPPANSFRTISPDPATSTAYPPSTSHARAHSHPAISPTSSLSAVSESPEQSPARPPWADHLSHATQDDGVWGNLLSMSGVQQAQAAQALAEGKKFWGKLVETVSAAAAGNAPSARTSDGEGGGVSADGSLADSDDGDSPGLGGGLGSPTSLFKNMLPWSTTTSAQSHPHPLTQKGNGSVTAPPMPANSMRLPSRQSSGSSSVRSASVPSKGRSKSSRPGGETGLDDLLGGDDLLGDADAQELEFKPTMQASKREHAEREKKRASKDIIGEAENDGWSWM